MDTFYRQVAGNTGYALKIWDRSYAMLGVPMDGSQPMKFKGGCPFASRPDSVVVYLDYNVAAGDSAMIMFYLSNGDSTVVSNNYFITGNSGGSFVRKAFPVSYLNNLMPDSMAMGFIDFNIMSQTMPDLSASFMTIDDISFVPPAAPICNNDLEEWVEFTCPSPDGWYYSKSILIDPADLPGSRRILQDIYSPPSDFSLEVRSIPRFSTYFKGEISTSPNKDVYPSRHGFAVSRRYNFFNGYYKCFPANGDTSRIAIAVYKNGEMAGSAFKDIPDTVAEFMPFDLRINYINDSIIPDSTVIDIISAGKPARGFTILYVDKLSFDALWDSLPAIVVSAPVIDSRGEVLIYPNPGNDLLTIAATGFTSQKMAVEIYDLAGRMIYGRENIPVTNEKALFEINTSAMESGVFIIHISSGAEHRVMKWVKL